MCKVVKNIFTKIENEDFDFSKISSLSSEAKQKLNKVKPKTIAQAGRISGVSPADINVLLIYLGR